MHWSNMDNKITTTIPTFHLLWISNCHLFCLSNLLKEGCEKGHYKCCWLALVSCLNLSISEIETTYIASRYVAIEKSQNNSDIFLFIE